MDTIPDAEVVMGWQHDSVVVLYFSSKTDAVHGKAELALQVFPTWNEAEEALGVSGFQADRNGLRVVQ
ncbi:MAG: hypothetical protein ACREJQ_04355 [bacterium]